MPVVLDATWVGRRVVLRRRVPGGFRDVLGDLLSVDADAVVATSAGPVRVPIGEVEVARLVGPSASAVLALEAVAERGWRAAARVELGGWVLRSDPGYSRRANSVLPLRQPGRPLDDQLDLARAWYHERDQPLRLQLPLDARRMLDVALAERDFVASESTHVLTSRLGASASPSDEVEISAEPSAEWLAWWHDRVAPAAPATADDLLGRHPRASFAAVRRSGGPVAIGRGVVDDDWLGLTDVFVDPDERRTGLATTVIGALTAWATGLGATRSYLQEPEHDEDPHDQRRDRSQRRPAGAAGERRQGGHAEHGDEHGHRQQDGTDVERGQQHREQCRQRRIQAIHDDAGDPD